MAGDREHSASVTALKTYYLTVYLGLGALLPLMALAMKARGFTPGQYSWVLALLPLSRLLSPPLWGALADKWLGTTRLLRINTWLAGLSMLAFTQCHGFVSTLLCYAAWALFSSSLMPLTEAGTYRLLKDRAENFSFIRVWGSIGFAVSAAVMGIMGVDKDMRAPFLAAAVFYLAAAVTSHFFADTHGEIIRVPLLGTVRALLKKRDVVLLWAASTLYYAAHGAFDSYFGPHVDDMPGLGARTVLLCWAIGVICEVVVLFYVPALLRTFQASQLLAFSALVAAGRWFLLAYATTQLEVLLLAPAHAITFGVWYLAFVHDNQEGAPPELRATVQGLAAACLGLGMITATLLGGYVLDHWSGRVLFEAAGACALGSLLLYALRMRFMARDARVVAAPVSGP
jgi:PPP family 3-phenylpropionic acid transporter